MQSPREAVMSTCCFTIFTSPEMPRNLHYGEAYTRENMFSHSISRLFCGRSINPYTLRFRMFYTRLCFSPTRWFAEYSKCKCPTAMNHPTASLAYLAGFLHDWSFKAANIRSKHAWNSCFLIPWTHFFVQRCGRFPIFPAMTWPQVSSWNDHHGD